MIPIGLISRQEWLQRTIEFVTLEHEFAVMPLVGCLLIGLICGVVGVFLVLRGFSLLGDAVGHATLPGVCVGFLLAGEKSMPFLLGGATASGVLAAFLIGVFSRGTRTRSDAALATVLSVFFGMGIVLLSFIQRSPAGGQAGLNHFLFGNAAGIVAEDLVAIGVVTLVALGAAIVFLRPLLLTIFDREFALSLGVRVRSVDFALVILLSVVIVVSIQAVGVVLVAAMLVIPSSAALLICRRLVSALAVAGAVGLGAGLVGAYTSFVLEGFSTGPSMVLAGAVFFFCALCARTWNARSLMPLESEL
jgi:manganese transport system permease protein